MVGSSLLASIKKFLDYFIFFFLKEYGCGKASLLHLFFSFPFDLHVWVCCFCVLQKAYCLHHKKETKVPPPIPTWIFCLLSLLNPLSKS